MWFCMQFGTPYPLLQLEIIHYTKQVLTNGLDLKYGPGKRKEETQHTTGLWTALYYSRETGEKPVGLVHCCGFAVVAKHLNLK